ncbi:hypothetical protein Cgig2_013211 [Carnegiea gigantea]|uniref:Uncharacterized protein n=1 Tax=Carnegiea gigantea TaxID=171969 RepID=A0A9Q1QNU2_9CARY|nr:hypothetical protein Cgig2_013211 [Carnegiea gigantea]
MVPTMVFDGKEAPHFPSPHNDPLVVEMKIASDCLEKLTYLRRDIVPLVHPILDFSGQEVNPTGMIRLLVRFGNKLKAKNLEVDFLIVDIPTAYNVILGCSTFYKKKKKKKEEEKRKRTKQNKRWGSYTSGTPLSSRPSSSGVPASVSKGLVASSSGPSPSPEGVMNSISSGSRPSASAR